MSAVVDIDLVLPQVMRHAPKCPEPLALEEIRNAAIELCERTRLWRENDEITLQRPAAQGVCTVQDASIISIEWADLEGVELEPVTVPWLDDRHPRWSYDETEAGAARYITQLTPSTVTVYPRAEGLLRMRLILKPCLDAFTLPAFLREHHATVIGKGAAGRVLTTAGEWANPQLGAALVGEFQSLLDTLSLRATKGQQGARLRTKGRYL